MATAGKRSGRAFDPARELRAGVASEPIGNGAWVIGDLHLDPGGDARVDGFVAWLERLPTDVRLIILGDLFDVWVGPAQARMEGALRVLTALRACTEGGRAVDVVPGNRDFLLGSAFEIQTGARVRRGGMLLEREAERTLLVHGDELCSLDHAYQRMKNVLRSRPMTTLAPRLPLAVARWAAGRLRRASRRAVPRKALAEKSMQADACREVARAVGAATVLCGHAHEFRDERLADGPRWVVLDAWGGKRDVVRLLPAGGLEAQSSGV